MKQVRVALCQSQFCAGGHCWAAQRGQVCNLQPAGWSEASAGAWQNSWWKRVRSEGLRGRAVVAACRCTTRRRPMSRATTARASRAWATCPLLPLTPPVRCPPDRSSGQRTLQHATGRPCPTERWAARAGAAVAGEQHPGAHGEPHRQRPAAQPRGAAGAGRARRRAAQRPRRRCLAARPQPAARAAGRQQSGGAGAQRGTRRARLRVHLCVCSASPEPLLVVPQTTLRRRRRAWGWASP